MAATTLPLNSLPQHRLAPRPVPGRRHLAAVPGPAAAVGAPAGTGRRLLLAVLVLAVVLAVTALVRSAPVPGDGGAAAGSAVAGARVAAAGDSMWSIARAEAPAGEVAPYVERLVHLNGGAVVRPGQVVLLPVP